MKSEVCGKVSDTNWSKSITSGSWVCNENTNRIQCRLKCEDGFNTRTMTMCRKKINLHGYNQWSQPKEYNPQDCLKCATNVLATHYPIQGGQWNCTTESEMNRSVRFCSVSCQNGMQINGSAHCRSSKGWKMTKGSKRFRKFGNLSCF